MLISKVGMRKNTVKKTMKSLDKNFYREEKSDLISSYKKLANILELKT